jgi:hypothetical protein
LSPLPGPIRQIGYVVTDLDKALAGWVELGVGPWFVMRGLPQHVTYRGEPCEITLSLALANSGDMQFEVIQQQDDTPQHLHRISLIWARRVPPVCLLDRRFRRHDAGGRECRLARGVVGRRGRRHSVRLRRARDYDPRVEMVGGGPLTALSSPCPQRPNVRRTPTVAQRPRRPQSSAHLSSPA